MDQIHLKEIKAISYKKTTINKGYADRSLRINLDAKDIIITPIEEKVKNKFIGGKGYDLWLMWNAVLGDTKWNDPENTICISSGPLGGTPGYPGGGKSIVTSISPLTGAPIDSNVGGYFGPYKKFSGFDALQIDGKAEEETIIVIDGIENTIKLFEAKNLPTDAYELSDVLTRYFDKEKPVNVSVVTTGPGAKHTFFGCLNFSWWDAGRKRVRYKQAGRGGIGTVFADKKIKAIVARCGAISMKTNNPADFESLKAVTKTHAKEIHNLDPKQNRMALVGTTHLVPIMNDHDCLPVHNFKFGSHPQSHAIGEEIFEHLFDKGFDGCWKGCAVACSHGVKDFSPMTGPYKGKKVFVDGPEYETIAGCGANLGIFDAHTIVEINFYCDAYGLDTISVGTSIGFVMECFENNLITADHTGGMELSFGSRLNSLEIIHQMARGEGFGRIVGKGVRQMKKIFATDFGANTDFMQDIGMESKGLEFSEYITKESLAQQGGYGLALKGPQHDEAWLIFLDMVHNFMPTFENKAEALHWFPMFRTWFGLCGLCKLPWNDIIPEDNKTTSEPAKVIKHVGWYADFFSAVTGRKTKPDDLILMSEAVYNFQRIFNLKMGFGTREHDTLPYRAIGPVTVEEYESRQERYDQQLTDKYGITINNMDSKEKTAVLRQKREEQYELLKDAVYERRGWNKNGIPTLETVKNLGIDFPEVMEILKKNGVTK
ncbi:aldehyde ferredoxin oxidoreductase family protein [Desulfobacula toluolica]|uniref:Aor4: tungsten-containing aldehyde ferredoxin oxidoreductase n=1 Tax=Desulfobacula toluolica (strain DSM 7467 / Tol2) TaxID=651182 RepID=K0N3N1_DESTT|nr:aldehyde ferredoxin oxidoreductase C-terminal domain-containing protein [Desulfobacula toluolica]CCK78734.1 Aor4: tungsten-containing aldehyde ferredoxin oxidoreductase [Desulfobacula toluolica Tol2]